MRKKKVLFHSDFALAKTGFGRAMKALLSYLYKTGKYEIHHLCCGVIDSSRELSFTPWKSYGTVPSEKSKLDEIQKDPNLARLTSYGAATLDKYVSEIKPDVYIGVQDFWGVDYSIEKNWFKKINSCLWITLDSLPILQSAVKKAHLIKNYWVWSNFAEKALKKLGHDHVETVHGPIEAKKFFKFSEEEKLELRKRNNIPEDAFIIGFVFRNQLRKLLPNLMEGYKIWKDRHPEIKNTRLLLHTSFSEGWNIKSQADLNGIDTKEILTTYVCSKCGEYEVKTFDDRISKFILDEDGSIKKDSETGEPIEAPVDNGPKDCRFCGESKSQNTTNVGLGCSEEQLNCVYNLMNVYVHPFTSGGQEIPIQEAKLAELVTLVTNYSCGEESCEPEAGSLPLSWHKYIEHGTEFIKASTDANSIADQLDFFFSMPKEEKEEYGKKAREWVIKNFSAESVGKKVESFLDNCDLIDQSDEGIFSSKDTVNENPNAEIDGSLPDVAWLKSLYDKILDRRVSDDDDGLLYWVNEINKGTQKDKIENYFRSVAKRDLEEKNKENNSIENILLKSGKKRILYVMPRSIGDCFLSTAIFPSIRSIYPEDEWDFYVTTLPEYKDIFDGNKHITSWLPYTEQFENHMLMEGIGGHNGWFDVCFTPHISTQRSMNYIHNGKNKLLM
jgi:glycosyltransferase involved in cell wall biosynthesis